MERDDDNMNEDDSEEQEEDVVDFNNEEQLKNIAADYIAQEEEEVSEYVKEFRWNEVDIVVEQIKEAFAENVLDEESSSEDVIKFLENRDINGPFFDNDEELGDFLKSES